MITRQSRWEVSRSDGGGSPKHQGFVKIDARGGTYPRYGLATAVCITLASCTSDTPAHHYKAALSAETYETGVVSCQSIGDPDISGDCLVAVMERHQRLALSDCDVVPAGLWHDECVFLYAERAAKAGDATGAFAACGQTRFGRECMFHLIRADAERRVDLPLAEASEGARLWVGHPSVPDGPRLFWKTWFRARLKAGIAIDPTDCKADACLLGARTTLYESLSALAHAAGKGFCDAELPTGKVGERQLWVDSSVTSAWVASWKVNECTRRELDPRAEPVVAAGPAAPG